MVNYPLGIASLLVILTIVGIFIWDIATKRWDALSWRNLFLIGFLHFYGLSSYFVATGQLPPYGGSGAMNTLAALMPLFLGVFLCAAWWARRRAGLARLIPRMELPLTAPGVVGGGAVFLAIGLLVTAFAALTYLSAVLGFVRGQIAAAGLGLLAYYVMVRRFNPAGWAILFAALAGALVISVVGSIGRRTTVSVLLALPWVWYFASWRYRRPAANFARLGAAVAVGALAILVYSPIRHEKVGYKGSGATLQTRAQQLLEVAANPFAKVDWKHIQLLLYADTAPNTIFIIDNYPDQSPHQPFAGLVWIAVNPIPRAWWPDKPQGLGIILQQQMHAHANLGAGIIGSGWYEGSVIGVLGYALFFGVLVGVADRALAERAANPFFVVLLGGNLGNIVGLPRGDTAALFMEVMLGLVTLSLVMGAMKISFGRVAAAFPPLPVPPGAPAEPWDAEALDPLPEPDGDAWEPG